MSGSGRRIVIIATMMERPRTARLGSVIAVTRRRLTQVCVGYLDPRIHKKKHLLNNRRHSFVIDDNCRCPLRREKGLDLLGTAVLVGKAANHDADVADLDDAFGGLAEEGELHHTPAKSIDRRLARTGTDGFQDDMLRTDQCRPRCGAPGRGRPLAENRSQDRRNLYGLLIATNKLPREQIAASDKCGNECVARLIVNLAWRADLHDRTVVHDGDAIRQRQSFGLVMGDVDSRYADFLLQPAQFTAHLFAQQGVEIAQRLVEQEQARLAHESARQRQPLLLATAQLRRRTLGQCREPHGFQCPHHPLLDVSFAPAPVACHAQWKRGVVEHVHVRPHRIRLEHHAEPALIGGYEDAFVEIEDDAVIEGHAAAAGLLETGHRPQGRAFAAAGWSEQRIELPGRYIEADTADAAAVLGSIELGEIFHL